MDRPKNARYDLGGLPCGLERNFADHKVERLCADASFATPDIGGSLTTTECGRQVAPAIGA